MPLGDVDRSERTGLQPATHGDLAIPRVEPQHDPPRKGQGEFLEQSGVFNRHAPHNKPLHSRSHIRAGRVDRPDPATELAGHSRCRHHAGHEFGLQGDPCLGTVEIDDVQPPGTASRKPPRHLRGIISKHGLAGIVALQQSHALTAAKVDGGPEFHGLFSCGYVVMRKRRRSSMPAAWLFSGWNCVANSLPRATAAQNGPP